MRGLRTSAAATRIRWLWAAGEGRQWIAGAVGWRLAEGEGRVLAGAFDGIEADDDEVDCVAVMPTRSERAFRVVSQPVEPSRALPYGGYLPFDAAVGLAGWGGGRAVDGNVVLTVFQPPGSRSTVSAWCIGSQTTLAAIVRALPVLIRGL